MPCTYRFSVLVRDLRCSIGEEYEQIFLQYQWEFEEYLGRDWEQMEPVAIVRKLVAQLF